MGWNTLACVRPCHPGAETAPLRESHPPRDPRVFPVRPCVLGSPPAEGRAPHAREERSRLTGACVLLATRPSLAHDNHVMPRPPSGPYLRTHGVRPSEKITFRVISGTSPQGHRNSNRPPRGVNGVTRLIGFGRVPYKGSASWGLAYFTWGYGVLPGLKAAT